MFVCVYTLLPRMLRYSFNYDKIKYENEWVPESQSWRFETEKSLAFAGTRNPDRPGRNAGTGHVEHNMITSRNSAGGNSELHDSLYSIHDKHYV